MAPTDAQKRARDKWLHDKVDDIRFRVPKGKKAIIQEHAAKHGESVNAFISRAPEAVVQAEREKADKARALIDQLQDSLDALKKL